MQHFIAVLMHTSLKDENVNFVTELMWEKREQMDQMVAFIKEHPQATQTELLKTAVKISEEENTGNKKLRESTSDEKQTTKRLIDLFLQKGLTKDSVIAMFLLIPEEEQQQEMIRFLENDPLGNEDDIIDKAMELTKDEEE